MRTFKTVKEAFEWWIKNKYPDLPADLKKGKAVAAWKDYTYNRGISESRMKAILVEFGNFEISTTTTITYKP